MKDVCILRQKNCIRCTLLVLANKQYQSTALSTTKTTKRLNLVGLNDRSWSSIPSSAIKGRRIIQGFDWLVETIKEKQT